MSITQDSEHKMGKRQDEEYILSIIGGRFEDMTAPQIGEIKRDLMLGRSITIPSENSFACGSCDIKLNMVACTGCGVYHKNNSQCEACARYAEFHDEMR